MIYQQVFVKLGLKSSLLFLQVFIFDGKVHIIPIPETPAELTFLPHTLPSIQEAIICLREHQEVTMANEKIQQDILARVTE